MVSSTRAHSPWARDRLARLAERKPLATSGGEFYDSYYTVQGVETIVPVDASVLGCPLRREAQIEGILKLREKIEKQRLKIRKDVL